MPPAAATHSTALLLALLPLLAAAPAPAPAASFCDAPSSFALEWSDEFAGPALDAATWFAVEGTSPHPFDSTCRGDECPVFSGCREGLCLRRNAWVADGALHLRSDNAGTWPSTFTTAAVASRGRRNFSWADGPFRLCVNVTLPGAVGADNRGLWPAIWMLPDVPQPGACDPDGGEVDLIEMVDGNASNVPIDYWWQPAWPARGCAAPPGPNASHLIKVLPDLGDAWAGWHEFAVESGPTWLAAAFDGAVVLNWTTQETGAPFYPTPKYLIINTALGGGWPSNPTNATQWPAVFKVDYVRLARAIPGAAPGPDAEGAA